MNPILILAALAGGYLLLKGKTGGGAGGLIPTTGTRTPPQPGRAPQGGPAGQQGGTGTAALIAASGAVVTAGAGAFVSLYDALSTSQSAPPDPAPTPVTAPGIAGGTMGLSGGSMAGSDWLGFAGSPIYDPGAGDALFNAQGV